MTTDETKDRAEALYVNHRRKLVDISAILDVSVRSLQDWKRKGEWDKKRGSLEATIGDFHREVYLLGTELARKLRIDLQAGKLIESERYLELKRTIDSAVQMYGYEKKQVADSPLKAVSTKPATRAEIEKEMSRLLGR